MHYQKLQKHQEKISHLNYAVGQLSWDESAMMPSGGGEIKSKAMATLAGLIHQNLTEPWLEEAMESAKEEELGPWEKRNLELLAEDHKKRKALSQEFVERKTYALSRSEQAWPEFKKNHDWEGFLPHLENVFAIIKEEAAILGETLGKNPYDALLHQYEPELTQKIVDPLFAKLEQTMPSLIQEVREKQKSWELIPFPEVSVEEQHRLSLALMKIVGFDFEHGRLDTSAHPFCGGDPRDVRLTTRYNPKDLSTSLMAVMHETGHAMYEQGRPKDWLDQPVGSYIGMAAHESQSLFMEMQICLGTPFLEVLSNPSFTTQNLITRYHLAEPGFTRVEADELTYPMHVILRYNLEKDLFSGNLEVRDIPERWNSMMKDYLGLDPKDKHGLGSLQDVHWPCGLCGYFPSYTLGAMIAACLRKQMNVDIPELDSQIGKQDFAPMFAWLRKNFHGTGSMMNTDQLLKKITGSGIDVDVYLDHLRVRYL
jgi:carboxypeptidase Taq